jgi:hypothetical protein
VEPTEAQYLILNALETLGLIVYSLYDPDRGVWYIATPSLVLPIARILPDGEIAPVTPEEYEPNE